MTIDWLLEGDAAIRWQAMRDLTHASAEEVHDERARVATTGWGRRLLDLQSDDGRWAAHRGPAEYRGLYTPKWTSTTYTLLLLRRLGLEPRHPAALRGCAALIDRAQWFEDGSIAPWSAAKTDMCVCGMILGIFEWFDADDDERRTGLLRFLLAHQKDDGGWNCRDGSPVSSMHTTLSVLEGLRLRHANVPDEAVQNAMLRGREYLAQRGLFRSLRTGNIILSSFKKFSFPPRWKYDVLRALDHFQDADAARDDRLTEAIELLLNKRRADGKWTVQNRHPGESHFEMEKTGSASRWNTLRALRVVNWWRSS